MSSTRKSLVLATSVRWFCRCCEVINNKSIIGFVCSAFDEEVTIRYFTQYLITTYCRAAPYFFGIVAAHYLRKPEDLPKLSYLWRVFGWIVTMLGIAIVVFGLVPAFNGYPLSTSAAAAFNSLSHIIWSLALAWIAYICVTNHGGLVECFLGWRFWTPFSTISYSTYLFSPIMICVYYLSREEPIRFSHYNAVSHVFSSRTPSRSVRGREGHREALVGVLKCEAWRPC